MEIERLLIDACHICLRQVEERRRATEDMCGNWKPADGRWRGFDAIPMDYVGRELPFSKQRVIIALDSKPETGISYEVFEAGRIHGFTSSMPCTPWARAIQALYARGARYLVVENVAEAPLTVTNAPDTAIGA